MGGFPLKACGNDGDFAETLPCIDRLLPIRLQLPMIVSFAHKGLERFYHTGNTSGIQAAHTSKLRLILTLLDAANAVEGMRLPALRLHKLKGARSNTWSVTVHANWRITFHFENGNAHIVNDEDYH